MREGLRSDQLTSTCTQIFLSEHFSENYRNRLDIQENIDQMDDERPPDPPDDRARGSATTSSEVCQGNDGKTNLQKYLSNEMDDLELASSSLGQYVLTRLLYGSPEKVLKGKNPETEGATESREHGSPTPTNRLQQRKETNDKRQRESTGSTEKSHVNKRPQFSNVLAENTDSDITAKNESNSDDENELNNSARRHKHS